MNVLWIRNWWALLGQTLRVHSSGGSTFLREMWCEIENPSRQSMRVYLKNNPAKCRPQTDPTGDYIPSPLSQTPGCGNNSATRHPIDFVFGSRLGFVLARIALFNLTAHELHELYYDRPTS